MTPIPTLLQQLGWPDRAKDDRGSMTWTASTGDTFDTLRSTSAAVMVGHDKITARMRSASLAEEGAMEPHLEIVWTLAGDNARLERFVEAGQEKPLDEAAALEAFQNAVNRLGVAPKFQQMAPRNTPAAPTISRPGTP